MAEYYPDPDTARRVQSCIRAGMTDEKRIATLCKITQAQLTKHYQYELGYVDDEDLAVVADVAYEMATCGKFPHMTQWWLKQKGGIVWQDKKPDEVGTSNQPLVIVLKGELTEAQ
jgi:hypothetical protein